MMRFASRSLGEHLGRGACAALLIGLAVWLISTSTALGIGVAIVALGAAVWFMRGCPTCWLIGLFETVARVAHRDSAHS